MAQKTAVTEVIKSLAEVESRFHLIRTEDEQFFTEWYENLPEITDEEKASLDVIRRRYLYHLADGSLSEGTVTLLMGSPLLEKAGFYDYPFKMRGEASVEIAFDVDSEEETLRGRIDILVLQNQFWVTLLESKRTTISVMSALPQTLTYMMASVRSPKGRLLSGASHKPVFGMMTNGDGIVFVKLDGQNTLEYDVSGVFSPAPLRNQLYTVLQVLKRIGQIIT